MLSRFWTDFKEDPGKLSLFEALRQPKRWEKLKRAFITKLDSADL